MLRPGSRLRAFAVVTALAVGAGAALGVLIAIGAVIVAIIMNRPPTPRDIAGVAALGAAWGAVFGLVLGPLTAFGLLRSVPLGTAILSTGIGAALGVIATFFVGMSPFYIIPVGFLVGALYARLRHSRPASGAGKTPT